MPHGTHRLDDRDEFAAGLGQLVRDLVPSWRRVTTPARTSIVNRFDSRAGDIRGTPRRIALNCRLPSISSRMISIVHRSSSSSIALATGQNWP